MPDPNGKNSNPPKDPNRIEQEFFSAAETLETERPRSPWVNVAAVILFACVILSVVGMFVGTLITHILALVGMLVFSSALIALLHFSRGAIQCPKCRQDFTNCSAVYCHNCGRALRSERCEPCGVNWNWTTALSDASESQGNRHRILFCPGCGAFLGSEHYRAGSEPWYENQSD